MRRINNSVVTTRDIAEPVCRSKSYLSPTEGGLRMSIPHEPVSSQKLVPWRTQPMVRTTSALFTNRFLRKLVFLYFHHLLTIALEPVAYLVIEPRQGNVQRYLSLFI
jgi:hypothetical protein